MNTLFDIAVEKMKKYCAYRERSHTEVRTKLIKDKIYGDELEEILSILIQEDFLNEERFAKAYVNGKFNQNKWGKIRILQGLKNQNISDYCIRKAIEEIDDNKYFETLLQLKRKKEREIKSDDFIEKKQKVMRFLLSKGYDYATINKSYNEIE